MPESQSGRRGRPISPAESGPAQLTYWSGNMSESLEQKYRPLLEAIAFAGRAHHGQMRKDGRTPYVSHVYRVCLIVRDVFGVADPEVLAAAVLHDTLEDTTTDFDDLEEQFGRDVAAWAAALSKDKRLVEGAREKAYVAALRSSPWQVQVCKLADIYDNLSDVANLPSARRPHALARAEQYFAALKQIKAPEAVKPIALVERLLAELHGAGGSSSRKD